MARIEVPPGDGSERHRFWMMQPALGKPAAKLQEAVYGDMELSVRDREAARRRIATINECLVCLDLRPGDMSDYGLDEDFYQSIADYRTRSDLYSPREQLAIEYAERFALDHKGIDDDLFDRLREEFSEAEIMELSTVIARHFAFGRMTMVLQLYGDGCAVDGGLPSDPYQRIADTEPQKVAGGPL